jgi:hypothetical protein
VVVVVVGGGYCTVLDCTVVDIGVFAYHPHFTKIGSVPYE